MGDYGMSLSSFILGAGFGGLITGIIAKFYFYPIVFQEGYNRAIQCLGGLLC